MGYIRKLKSELKGVAMFRITFIVLILICKFLTAQNTNKIQPLLTLPFNKLHSIPLKISSKNITKSYALNRDFIFDNEENIILYNEKDFSIDKYDNKGTKVFKIDLLPFVSLKQKKYFNLNLIKVNLELDSKSNIYCLLTYNELKSDLFKFDTDGSYIDKIKLSGGPTPKGFNTYYISPSDNIFIYTFNVTQMFNSDYKNKGNVLVYDNTGKYIGRTTFFIQDKNHNYYSHIESGNSFIVTKYLNPNNIVEANKAIYTKSKSLRINFIHDYSNHSNKYEVDRWYFVGIDNDDNLYYTNNKQVAKFNFNSDKVKFINYSNITKSNLYSSYKAIRVNRYGKIIIKAVTSNTQTMVKDYFFDKRDLQIVFVKLDY